jgi:hypothetical protein
VQSPSDPPAGELFDLAETAGPDLVLLDYSLIAMTGDRRSVV